MPTEKKKREQIGSTVLLSFVGSAEEEKAEERHLRVRYVPHGPMFDEDHN